MNVSVRHHSVPQFLLRNFADAEGLLYHFDKQAPEKGIRHEGPKGIFSENHLYSVPDLTTGALDVSAESFFDKDVENPTAPIVRKIITAVRKGKKPALTKEQKRQLDLFMEYQFRRTPELVRQYGAFQIGANTVIANLEREHGELPQELKDEITDPTSAISKGAIVGAQVQASPDVAAILRVRGLLIASIADTKKAFAIGSNPMVPLPPPGLSEFGVHGFWLPIASDVAISAGGPAENEDVRQIVDHRGIRRLNEMMFRRSDKIASRSGKLTDSLVNQR